MPDAGLDRLASLAGIEPRFRDAAGEMREAHPETKRALLRAKGFRVDSADDIAAAIAAREERPWRRPLGPVRVWQWRRKGRPVLALQLPRDRAPASIDWTLELETGENRHGTLHPADLDIEDCRTIDGEPIARRLFELPFAPPHGYHRFRLRGGHAGLEEAQLALIVTPKECYLPLERQADTAIWGFAVQLYALRSERNWGIGDFSDLSRLAETAKGLGAEAVGLNPLHALFVANPGHASPYSPSSRLFLNTLYIDVEAVPDFGDSAAAQQLASSEPFRAELDRLRRTKLVDYERVARAKRRIFDLLYDSFRRRQLGDRDGNGGETARGRAFRQFQRRSRRDLEMFGVFEALSERFGTCVWKEWPVSYRRADTAEVRDFAQTNRRRVEFFQYLQWEADRQLGAANETVGSLGMVPGLYHDLALGVDANSMESWARQDLVVRGASLGAPPDSWNLKGQNWGSPPVDPDALRQQAYRPYIEMLRANMGHGGALRIDHVMSLMRLYWIPEGAEPGDGAYVRYPFEDLLGILALESRRQECMVVGEDLGTVPEDFQVKAQEAGVLSYRLLYFQQDNAGEFLPPADYPRLAATAVGTHDLATLPGYWTGHDLEVRSELDLFPSEESKDAALSTRAVEREKLLAALKRERLLPLDFEMEADRLDPLLVEAAYRFLGRTPSLLTIVHLEDVLGEVDQVNLPGTTHQHPNWRRKIFLKLEDFATDPRISSLASALREARSGAGGRRTP